ncbi:alpha/beta fold hydrolase [Planococcus shenhongbingii]|uniref:alpha/beta hydrolase n=1 Tax=Planococcus shenhongbingii TaxID=3058398 RepID=UPI002613CAF6|nr:alpha/beta fold hydrolase [Planococcus sp. N016]WKA59084.1 alpha/beta fold hydrolase [Planococcus sp. N016]
MKTGVLCIHGFTGGPYEVQPFADFIEKQTDWIVKVPTLPGHGEILSLRRMKAEHWMMEAELALRELKKEADRIIIVGFSMGGLIAMYLALRYKVDRLVLLSAAAKYISAKQLLEEIKETMADAVKRKLKDNEFFQQYKYKLTHTPIFSTAEFLKVLKTIEPYYQQIKVPVCIVQGRKDGIVPVSSADHIYNSVGSDEKHIIHSESGKHLICYSDDCDDWFMKVLGFMKKGAE